MHTPPMPSVILLSTYSINKIKKKKVNTRSYEVRGGCYQESGQGIGLSEGDGDVGEHDAVGNGDGGNVRFAGAVQFVLDGSLRPVGHRHEVGLLLDVLCHEIQVPNGVNESIKIADLSHLIT